MISNVNKIKSNSFDTIKKDGALTMLLLKTYSKLYKEGKQIKTCENSMLKYYNEILKTGIQMADIKNQIKNRKYIPNFEGRREIYTKEGILLISAENLTDVKSSDLVKKGYLKKSDFKNMPEKQKTVSTQKNKKAKQ